MRKSVTSSPAIEICDNVDLDIVADESFLLKGFPECALRLLETIVEEQLWLSKERLMKCLVSIVQTVPKLESNQRYPRFIECAS